MVNTERKLLYVLDPASNRIVQRTTVEEGPDAVAFSDDFAYIRHRGSANVVMVSLKTAGKEGAPLSILRFPAGEAPPGSMADPTPADSMVPAPGAGAMLVANPGDRSVYYYKEGLSAPMGTFSNYKREPRAVLVLDRSLRERAEPGVYETVARLRPSRPVRAPLLPRPAPGRPRVSFRGPGRPRAGARAEARQGRRAADHRREPRGGRTDVPPLVPAHRPGDRLLQVGCQEPGDLDVQGRRGLAGSPPGARVRRGDLRGGLRAGRTRDL